MESLLHNTDKLGFTMLHMAAQEGKAEMVQLLIDDYNLDPTARTKVCGQTCRHFEMWVFTFPSTSPLFLVS